MRPRRHLPNLLKEPERVPPTWVRVLCLAGATIAFALGVVGWLVPVVTGVPFYMVGLALLAVGSRRTRVWINRAESRLSDTWRRRLRRALKKGRLDRFKNLFHLDTEPPPSREARASAAASSGPPETVAERRE